MTQTIELQTRLHQGIYREERDAMEAQDRQFPADTAHLHFALDLANYRSIVLGGSYGSIGCGSTDVVLVCDGGESVVCTTDRDDASREVWIEEGDARRCLPEMPDGELDDDEVEELVGLIGDVWDGNNHVRWEPVWSAVPDAALWTDEESCRWHEALDENPPEIELKSGWVVLDDYYGLWGNEGWNLPNVDCADDVETRLDAANVEYETIWLSNDDVVVLVRTEDEQRAREAFSSEDDE